MIIKSSPYDTYPLTPSLVLQLIFYTKTKSYPSPIASLDLIPFFLQKNEYFLPVFFLLLSSPLTLIPYATPSLSVSLLPSQNNVPISTHVFQESFSIVTNHLTFPPPLLTMIPHHFKSALFTVFPIAHILVDTPSDH